MNGTSKLIIFNALTKDQQDEVTIQVAALGIPEDVVFLAALLTMDEHNHGVFESVMDMLWSVDQEDAKRIWEQVRKSRRMTRQKRAERDGSSGTWNN